MKSQRITYPNQNLVINAPEPFDVAPAPTPDDLADVVGNTAYFNSVLVKGVAVGGTGPITTDTLTATSMVQTPIVTNPAGDLQLWRANSSFYGWKAGIGPGSEPMFCPLQDGTAIIGDAAHRVMSLYVYGKSQYHNYGTPSGNPPSGETWYYVKSDSKLYYKDSGGVELAVGSGIALTSTAAAARTSMENATTIADLRTALLAFIDAVGFTPTDIEPDPGPLTTNE